MFMHFVYEYLSDETCERDLFIVTMMIKSHLCVEEAELLCDWLLSFDSGETELILNDIMEWFDEIVATSDGEKIVYGQYDRKAVCPEQCKEKG